MKSPASRAVKRLKTSLKGVAATLSQHLLKERSFAWTGIPYGLVSLDQQARTVYPSEPFLFTPPKCVQGDCHPRFPKESVLGSTHSMGVLAIDRGIATASGGNLTAEGKLVTTFLYPTDGKRPDQHELFHFRLSALRPPILRIDQPVISLTAGWQGAFYHWMYQILPRLAAIDTTSFIYVDQSHRFQRESMALLGLTDRVIDASKYPAVQGSQLIVPEPPQCPTPTSYTFLREAYLPQVPQSSKRRVYLSRGDAKTRRLANEKELLPILRAFGFETVIFSDLSLQEQMSWMRGAEMVVAPHGAGLSHLVFCDPGTPVLELFHPNYFNHCYWHLSLIAALSYHVLFDQHPSTERDPPIVIDPEHLKKSLEAMERDRPHR